MMTQRSLLIVFVRLMNYMTQKPLKNWLEQSGVSKYISDYCSRHPFGSLQVDAGTSIHAVQHMLGHKNLSTT
ncbi:MAG: tyrosine-type recombinase/integrase [Marinilabiliaceae bacterium]